MDEIRRRKSPRLRVALSVQLLGARHEVGLTTVDVSRGGIFLHTVEPRPMMQLLRLRVDPGDGCGPIVGHGVVVRVVDEDEARATGTEPGMGIEFYGFGGEPRQRWEDLLDGLATEPGVAFEASGARPPAERLQPVLCEAVHKLPGRPNVTLLITVSNVEQLFELCDTHLPAGALLVRTVVRLPAGTGVELRLTHPLSRDVYDLRGKVLAVVDDEPGPGLEVALTPGVETRRGELRRFIDDGLPEEELTLELLDE